MLVTALLDHSCSAKKYVYEHMDEDKKKRNIEKANLRKQEWYSFFLFLSFCRLAKKKLIRKEKKAEKLV